MRKIPSLIFVMAMLFMPVVFADGQVIIPMRPATRKDSLDDKIAAKKEEIKRSGYLDSLRPYLSVRQDDLTVCMNENCRDTAKQLLSVRYIAEGRCNEVGREFESLCKALKENKCDALSGGDKNFCVGLKEGSIEALLRAGSAPEYTRISHYKMDRAKAGLILGIYGGFKNYSEVACDRFMQDASFSLPSQLACKMFFCSDPDEALEGVAQDLAIFNYARKDKVLCGRIKNSKIRKMCGDSQCGEFKGLFDDVY